MTPPMLIDIGTNLLDSMYSGNYHHSSRQYHQPDHENVLRRAFASGVDRIIITSGTASDTVKIVELINKFSSNFVDENKATEHSDQTHYPKLYTTVGYHPTNTRQLHKTLTSTSIEERDAVYKEILAILETPHYRKHIVAIGEVGLDYDRFHFSSREEQLTFFPIALRLAVETQLPMFLHDRNTNNELVELIRPHRSRITNIVFHSFTGNRTELQAILDIDGYIGINGCSLKSKEQLELIPEVPLDRLLLETDAPWCGVKRTHASFGYIKTHFEQCKKEMIMIKDRNEPGTMIQIAEIVAALKQIPVEELIQQVHENTMKFFWPTTNTKTPDAVSLS
jgi:TatD DNase family protein